MAAFIDGFSFAMLRATAMLAVATLILQSLCWLMRFRSPGTQRMLWMLVLVQGIVLFRLPIEIPWCEPAAPSPVVSTEHNRSDDKAATFEPEENAKPIESESLNAGTKVATTVEAHKSTAENTHFEISGSSWNPLQVATIVWLLGFIALSCVAIVRYRKFTRKVGATNSIDDEWRQEWECALAEFGLKRAPAFIVTDVLGPALCLLPRGYCIVVPAKIWRVLSRAQRLAVLRHELAHYYNGDLWQSALAGLLCLFHWFNPLAWWALGRFQACGEWRCDEIVIEKSDRREFARALMQLGGTDLPSLSLVRQASGEGLFARIRRLLLPPEIPDRTIKKTGLTISTMMLFGLGLLQIRLVGYDSQAADIPKTIRDDAGSGRVDLVGDPIPAGAVLRLGNTRFRHGSGIEVLKFTRDSGQIVSLAGESIRFWQVPSGELLHELRSGSQQIEWFALSPDGHEIATIGFPARTEGTPPKVTIDFSKQMIEFYSLDTLKSNSKIVWADVPGLRCNHIAYLPDGKSLVTGSSDGTVRVWDRATGKLTLENRILNRKSSQYVIESLAVSSDGAVIAASDGVIVKVWKWRTQEQPLEIKVPARAGIGVSFSPDGRLIALGGYYKKDCGIALYDPSTGALVKKLMAPPLAYDAALPVFSSGGKTVSASVETPQAIATWDVETGELLRKYPDAKGRPAISPDDRWLACAESSSGAIKLFDFKSGRAEEPLSASNAGVIQGIHFLPQDDAIVTTSDDGTVRRWDGRNGQQVKLLGQHEKWIRASALSPDGKQIATSSLDDTVRIWDTDSGREIHRLPGHGDTGGTRAVAFTADGKRLASWGDDMDVRIWDVAVGTLIKEFELHPSGSKLPSKSEPNAQEKRYRETKGGLNRAAFSSTATPFVLDYDHSLHVFDVETGKELGQVASSTSIAVSPDGKMLVCSDRGGTERIRNSDGSITTTQADKHSVYLRELTSGKVVHEISLPGNSAGQVAFSRDGKMFAESTGNTPNVIRVWDTESRKQLVNIEGVPPTPPWQQTLTFSPDGNRLAVALKDATVLVWDIARP